VTWDTLTTRVADLLALRAKSRHRFLILAHAKEHRFVQFAAGEKPGSVVAEAISNSFLTTSERLGRRTITALRDRGWKSPTKKHPNFWRVYGGRMSSRKLALMAVEVMCKVFETTDPAALRVVCGRFATETAPAVPSLVSSLDGCGTPVLERGEQLTDLTNGRRYRVQARVGVGGFGTAYRVTQLGPGPRFAGKLCLKVSVRPEAWHQEAYFGNLLRGVRGAMQVRDSFAAVRRGSGGDSAMLYCLVSEFAAHGDLYHYLAGRATPWSEPRACREIATILRALASLHENGAVHRDLSPRNVLVSADEHLNLGDFGSARQRIIRKDVVADAFNPGFAPPAIAEGAARCWRAADDVYQMGVILAMLLGAHVEQRPHGIDVKRLTCSPAVKVIIQRAIGDRRKRYENAGAMLAAIERRTDNHRVRIRPPRSLAGKAVVFTGPLSTMTRKAASALARRRGARVYPEVTTATDIVVKGADAPLWKGDKKGQKLLDVDWVTEKGHRVCVIGERTFLRFVR
jgi:protein kinase-like protein/type III secretion system-like peptide-binding chaperone/BRCA1-like protein